MTQNNGGDSAELEALFDSVAAQTAVTQSAPAPVPPAKPAAIPGLGDNDELQALFDAVAFETAHAHDGDVAAAEAAKAAGADKAKAAAELLPDLSSENWPQQDMVFKKVGQMARALHDALHELGYDKLLENTVAAIPDARDRLAYIANLTEQAACKVLNATDIAKPLQDELELKSRSLAERWDRLYANEMGVDDFKVLAGETREFLKTDVPGNASATNQQLMEIMMAQDFQDLTGQVIKKVVVLAQQLENGLMNVLVEVMPEAKRNESVNSLLNGPVINSDGREDVVVNQRQVDDLLDSLGF